MLEKQRAEIVKIHEFCAEMKHNVEYTERKLKALKDGNMTIFEQLTDQISSVLIGDFIPVATVNADRFFEFVSERNLPHVAKLFQLHGIDGHTFAHVMTAEMFEEIGIRSAFDQRRVMDLQLQVQSGCMMMPSATRFAATVREAFENLKTDAQAFKEDTEAHWRHWYQLRVSHE